jgi:hypothetical protein
MGSYVRIIVPEFEAGRLRSVYVFSDKFPACCIKTIRSEWDYTVAHLKNKLGAPQEVIADFPKRTATVRLVRHSSLEASWKGCGTRSAPG